MEQSLILEICKTAAINASIAIMEVYNRDFSVEYKDDKSPVTEADKKADAIIRKELSTSFPTYAILSEETADDLSRINNDYCFIVDPLDGTKGFVARNGEFTVNIALAYKQRSIVGVVLIPLTGEIYFASKETGAFYQNGEKTEKIHVSALTEGLRMVRSKNHSCPEELNIANRPEVAESVQTGSSIKGCFVAHGKADIYYRFGPTSHWDTAAMQCVVEQAGGIFRALDKSEILYNTVNIRNAKGFFAVNCEGNIWI